MATIAIHQRPTGVSDGASTSNLATIKMDGYQDQRVGGCVGAVGCAAGVQADPERLGRLRVSLQVATQPGGDRLGIAGGGGGALHVAALQVQADPCGLLEVAPPNLAVGLGRDDVEVLAVAGVHAGQLMPATGRATLVGQDH